jgi:hypothetical protein
MLPNNNPLKSLNMNKIIRLITSVIFCAITLCACKKETASDNNKPKDYSTSIVNKTWWGTFSYKDQTDEYYSMHFNADNTLDWDQLLGQYKGFWTLESNRLTITFVGNDTKITAKIGDDNKLSQFSDNTDFSELKTGQLVENPLIRLENTVWTGMEKSKSDSISVKLEFNEKSQVLSTLSSQDYRYLSDYSRFSSGGALRVTIEGKNNFLVIVSENEMKGTAVSFQFPMHVTKQ